MRCPSCRSLEDKVVDSRVAEEGGAIRRRRECLGCGARFTTFERVESAGLRILKRSGERQPFDRAKIVAGVMQACKNRPVSEERIAALAEEIEEEFRGRGSAEVASEDVGRAVLDRLRDLDEVAYMRFASVYQGFKELGDFEREAVLLKKTPPKAAQREEESKPAL